MKVLKRRALTRRTLTLAACIGLSLAAAPARAGIPVIDVANLVQTIMQVINDVEEIANQILQIENQITQIDNQVKQVSQLDEQIRNAKGFRGWGSVLNSAGLQNYVPANAFQMADKLATGGYGGLSGTAKALRDAKMTYNCLELTDPGSRTSCQARLAAPYQHKALMQDGMGKAAGRLKQIEDLLSKVDATNDPKEVGEIQARVQAESALLTHELTQIQMAQGLASAEEQIARSRDAESQREAMTRTAKLADFLK